MKAPQRPFDESARLEALAQTGILDTAPEAVFDDLTRLAAHLLQVPIALVSIVDADRQWFKSRYGLVATETSREVSFCGHAILDPEPLVVPDAEADPRFHDNPLVTGDPYVRFYAGMPLTMADGHVLGTFCAIDHTPRIPTTVELELLRTLATQAVAQLELRRQRHLLAAERAAVRRWTQFFELGPDPKCSLDRELAIVDVNPSWNRWFRRDSGPWMSVVHRHDQAHVREALEALLTSGGEISDLQCRLLGPDREMPASISATAGSGLLYVYVRDLTALRAGDERVRESEARLSAVFEAMGEGLVVHGANGEIVSSNRMASEILGLTPDELAGRTSRDPRWQARGPGGVELRPDDHPAMVTLRTGESVRNRPMEIFHPSGTRKHLTVSSEPIARPWMLPHAVVATFRDVTREVHSTRALGEEGAFLEAVLRQLPGTSVAVFDAQLIIRRHFGAALRPDLKGQLVGRPLAELVPESVAVELIAGARGVLGGVGGRCDAVHEDRHLELRLVPFEHREGTVSLGMALVLDVTERDLLRDRLERQQRLVTTGTLAAGVGHEISNPLAFASTNLEFALDEIRLIGGLSPSARLRELLATLTEARNGLDRIRKIVRGLRAFAREEEAPVAVDVHGALEISANMSMHELRHRASFQTDLQAVGQVLADESRLCQVFVNLIVNAAQAFPEADPEVNVVTVRTSPSASGQVCIEVSDNGPGITDEVLPRIFDPFFTTKPVGHGTGLGLSISHSIVTGLGGTLTCIRHGTAGTTFQVLLPELREPDSGPMPQATQTSGVRGRVLIVDDEPAVVRSVARLLRGEHDVVGVHDAREARDLLVAPDAWFDVVFCDVMMPNLSGPELYAVVRAAHPALAERFVFVSGGVTFDSVRTFLAEVPNERMDKPFSSQNLRGVARRFVDSRR